MKSEKEKPGTPIEPAIAIEVKEEPKEDKRSSTSSFDESNPQSSHLKGFVVFLFNSVFITCCIASPAIYFISIDVRNLPNLSISTYDELVSAGQLEFIPQLVRWSIWISSLWFSAVHIWKFIDVLPWILVTITISCFGHCSDKWKSYFDYIPSIKNHIAVFLITLFGLVGFLLVFIQFAVVPYWLAIQKLLLVCFTFFLLLLIQRLIVQSIAINFHKVAYNERIEQSKFCMKTLDTLKLAIRTNEREKEKEREREEGFIARSKSLNKKKITFSQELHPKIKQTVEMEVASDNTANAILTESPTKSPTEGKDYMDTTSSIGMDPQKGSLSIGRFEDMKSLKILSEKNAIFLARRLFACLSNSNSNTVNMDAFLKLYPNEKEAQKAFEIFDVDADGDFSFTELKHVILNIYKEKRDLLRSLRDLSQALGQLNRILFGFVVAITAICMLPIYGIPVETVLPFTSLIIAWSFIFGGAARSTFECIIFIFVTHPFDTGDRVIVDDKGYFVDELNLLTTVLRTPDGQKMYISNARLAEKQIINIRRSPNQTDEVMFIVPNHTTEEQIAELNKMMQDFVRTRPKDYGENLYIFVKDFGPAGMTLMTFISHKANFQDGLRRQQRKTQFMFALKKCLHQLGIRFQLPEQKVKMVAPPA